jgi:TetR/AcrR family transcriptional repressor of uid operon
MTAEMPSDDRDALILDATEKLIAQRGFDRVRFIDVAEATDVSIGSMQHRFRNREGLLRAALERADARERSRWIDLTQGVDEPWERLLALLRNVIGMNPDAPVDPLWFQMLAVAQRDPSMHAVMRAQQDMWTLTYTQVIADGLESGRLTSDLTAEEAGLALMALTDGFYLARNIGDKPPSVELVTRIVETVVRRVIHVHPVRS